MLNIERRSPPMPRGRATCLLAFALIPVLCASAAPAPWRFSDVERVVAVSDIHGAYEELVEVLQASRVIDGGLGWTGGQTHLVVVGDVLDRGPGSRQALDLIMRLQQQAAAQGGDVHLTLGNHELMNLTGDLRYVSDEEYAAFAEDELPGARQAAFERFVVQSAEPRDEATARAAFDRQFPPGYFAHRAAFKPTGAYGAWLLEQPLLLVIDDTAFVHGGLSPAVSTLGGEAINAELAGELREYAATLDRLIQAGVLDDLADFSDHPAALDRYTARVGAGATTWSEGAAADAARLKALHASLVFRLDGPLWYRGTVSCSELIEADSLRAAFDALGVARVVVGHTPTTSRHVESRMGGAVLRIDTGMLASYYRGRPAALVLEGDAVSAVYPGQARTSPMAPVRGAHSALPLSVEDLEDLEAFLGHAAIVAQINDGETVRVMLREGNVELEAVFQPSPGRGFLPEVAAYRLDRLLGLGLAAVTAVREIDGRAGALQLLPRDAIDENERAARAAGGAAWCPLRRQIQAMYVFDTLIFNSARQREQMFYDRESFQLTLLGPQAAFSPARGRPAYLRDVEIELTDAWIARLQTLSQAQLEEVLGDVLSRRRIGALLQRRDALIASRN